MAPMTPTVRINPEDLRTNSLGAAVAVTSTLLCVGPSPSRAQRATLHDPSAIRASSARTRSQRQLGDESASIASIDVACMLDGPAARIPAGSFDQHQGVAPLDLQQLGICNRGDDRFERLHRPNRPRVEVPTEQSIDRRCLEVEFQEPRDDPAREERRLEDDRFATHRPEPDDLEDRLTEAQAKDGNEVSSREPLRALDEGARGKDPLADGFLEEPVKVGGVLTQLRLGNETPAPLSTGDQATLL